MLTARDSSCAPFPAPFSSLSPFTGPSPSRQISTLPRIDKTAGGIFSGQHLGVSPSSLSKTLCRNAFKNHDIIIKIVIFVNTSLTVTELDSLSLNISIMEVRYILIMQLRVNWSSKVICVLIKLGLKALN